MSDLAEEILNLELSEDIFKGIKFFISGEVHEKIIDLLKSGGAERLNYFSDYVTHLFVGDNPEENDIVDANDVYEIPALTPKWVVICADLKKLVSIKPYLYVPGGKLLSNLVFCFSNIREDRNYLWALITYNGGVVQLNLNRNCNYLVTTDTSSIKYEKAESFGSDFIKIVTPDWVVETVRNKSLADATLFHPKLINWPKPVKHESTTAITGFEPEQTENVEKTEEKPISDSTQALLEKLKQRMPWNQPSTPKTSSSSDPVAPPNVVAPSFIQKSPNQQQQSPRAQLPQTQNQQPQQITPQSPVSSSFPQIPRSPSTPLSNQQIPRSIVHHTPTQQNSFQQQQPQNPLNISRLIGQPQARPNIQQLRGQIGQSQLHQQLLQQRMQQNQQNIQRSSAGQITVQQQLLQQQLIQGQRQLLQNRLSQEQMLQQQQQGGSNQQTIGQNQQQLGTTPHLGQLTQQQLVQLQQQQLQLKQNQQQQLQQQLQLNPNQQIIQSQVLHQQQNQLSQQQQNQLNQQQLNQQQHNQLNQQQQNQLNQQQHNQLNQQQNQLNQQQQNQLNLQQQNQLNLQQQNQLNQQQQNQLNQQQQSQLSQQNQLSQQQQIQLNQSQTFVQQNLSQHITPQQTQQLFQQKQQLLSQQQTVTSQQQIIQNQPNLAVQQQQFVSQTFTQNQNVNQEINQQNMQQQQQNVNQQQSISQQLNAQALNQQLNSQNLGQQLNQQQLNQQLNQQQLNQHNQLSQQLGQQNLLGQQLGQQNQLGQQLNQQEPLSQQLNQQSHINQQLNQINQQNQLNRQSINQQALEQGLTQNINEALNQQLTQGLSQQLQQQQQLNRQSLQQQQQQLNSQQNLNQQIQVQQQQSLNQQNLQQQQQITQINQQISSGLPQQVVRAQFQQQGNISQQILINQQSPQNSSPQRAQINQHLWAQQPSQVPGQQIIRHPVNVVQQAGPRVQWSPNPQQGNAVPQRQFIQLDARTHNELQKMPPEQQALFVAKLQKQRQLLKQVQQRGGGGSHILIRGNVPPGLTTQQQVQWLQQQAKQQGIVLPPNIQQQNITPGTLTQPGLPQNIQHAPGLSPINQNNTQFIDQNQQQQLLRQYRLQQLQLQREQAQKNHLAQQQQGTIQQPTIVRPIGQPQLADSTTNPPQVPDGNIQHSLVVNAKTKTALANMLSIKLQSGGSSIGVQRPETLPEPSAAGTLRLMTAQHNAALNSKPQEIIALQRRTISGPNGEIIKPPGAPQLPITPTNEPPKLQYCPKPALPLQHRPGPFYGHNPNLKLPPDLFLLGCIFVVVELESFLEERIPGWQQKIEKHGGEVEKQYCSRVTHVLCETQRHGVVMQALRDCKRCVTILWLSDIMNRKQVLPPWTALHLPNIYLDTAPASKHLISISGFEGSERNRVKHMIKYTGAKCTTYFSKHNTLLISTKAEGKKCSYAKKWQIPVVNVQWLTDVMLGNFAAMNQMEHQIYQQFSNPPNFSFDPKLVPNLMVAWKAPINISQESYERVKRSASPVALPKKAKKPKIEATDENDNISDEHMTNSTYRILFSMVANTKEMQRMVRDLGGAIAKDHSDFTHLVMPYLVRSNKLFFAIAKGAQVVSEQWLKDSHATNQFLPESNYCLNSKDFNYEYKCDIDQTLLTRNRNKLFEGKFFFVTPSVFPSKKVIVELIQCCGGIVERIRRSSAQIEATSINSPYSYFIITHENDLHLVADLLRNKKDKMKIVCNVELIFSAILKQTFEVEPYAVCVL